MQFVSNANHPNRHRLWLLSLLLLLSQLASCGGEQFVLVTVLGTDAETSGFVASARLDGVLVVDSQRFPSNPPYFHLTLPSSSQGQLEVLIEALDGDACTRAQGRGAVHIDKNGQATVDVFLTKQPFATCPVRVLLPDAAQSRVVSMGGELDCTGSCVRPIRKGSSLALHVDPATGEHLLGFRLPCVGTEPCQVTVSKPTDVEVAVVKAQVCSPDAVCWDRPSPQGQTLRGLWGPSPRDIWAVGDAGSILHFDGISWVSTAVVSSETLNGMWGSATDRAWAVGEHGAILRYDGKQWASVASPTIESLRSIWGSSGSDIWAVGENGALIHYDGATWSQQAIGTTMAFSAVFGTGPRDVWAMGYGSQSFHYDGLKWNAVPMGSTLLVVGIWGASPSDLWAVGYDYTSRTGVILHSSGQTWIRYFATSGPRLYSVFGSPQGDVFAVGELGMLLRLAKGRWETLPPLTTNRLLSGALFSTQLGLAVGEGGTTLRFDGLAWKLASDGDITNLFAVSASEASDLWLVGDAGRVLHAHGGLFDRVPSTTTDPLRGVYAAKSDDVWIVGDFGTVLHYGGQRIDLVTSGVSTDFRGVYGFGSKDIWMVGRAGLLLHYDGQGFARTDTGLTQALHAVGGSSGSDVWAVGEQGVILHLVDGEWQRSWSRTGDTLRAVWAASPSEVWIVGDNGVIIRYNGSSYEYDFVGDERNPITLLGIAGQPGGEVYIVGQSGKMFRFDRTAWRAVESGTSGALSAVAKDQSGRYWFAGQGGAILHRDPK